MINLRVLILCAILVFGVDAELAYAKKKDKTTQKIILKVKLEKPLIEICETRFSKIFNKYVEKCKPK